MKLLKFSVTSMLILNSLTYLFGKPDISLEYDQLPVKVILFPFRKAVISSKVDGVVCKHYFREGKKFQKGDILAEIESLEYKEKLAKAQAAYDELKTNYELLKEIYKANLELSKKGIFSQKELKKNKTDMEIGFTRIKSAKAEKKLAEHKVKACFINAPFSGRIDEILIQEHEFVRTSEKVLSIIDDNRLLAIMHLPAKFNSNIKLGDSMSFKIANRNKVFSGKIFEKAASINHRSRTFQIKLVIDNIKGELTAGMSGLLIDKLANKTKK